MSIRPGINPLDKITPRFGHPPVYGPGPGQHYSFPTAEEMRKRMEDMRTSGKRVPVLGPNPHRIDRIPTRGDSSYGPGPGQHYSFPTRDISAEEALQKRMGPGFRTMEYVPGRDKSERRTLEYVPERDKSEIQLLSGGPVYGPGPGEMHRYQNTGGFDASDLMTTPGIRQQSTRDQAEKVSAPYMEANRKAAGKTNPMNAASQEPGMAFLMKYVGK